MGSVQRIVHGARIQILVNGKIVGLFTSAQWGVNYDAIPSFILGRFSPAEITYVGQDAISINATGFRVVDNGAYVAAGLPKLQELMTHEDIAFAVFDRQTGKKLFNAVGVRPVGYNSGAAARSISDFSVAYLALRAEDESGSQGEAPGASDILSGT